MNRKITAIIFVVLFVLTVCNSSIAAESGISRITMKKELMNARGELKKLNTKDIESCIETEDYSKLLKFMGEDSHIATNVHINMTGSGLYLIKQMKLVRILHPYTRLLQMGVPPYMLKFWLLYIKLNETYPEVKYNEQGKVVETGNTSNASIYIEYENGSSPKYINGSNSILVLFIQIPPVNKIINNCNLLNRWIKGWTGKNDTRFNISWSWSFEKWKFKNFWNYKVPLPNIVYTLEALFLLMYWPFNVWISPLNLRWGVEMRGMAPFIIWNNSTATS